MNKKADTVREHNAHIRNDYIGSNMLWEKIAPQFPAGMGDCIKVSHIMFADVLSRIHLDQAPARFRQALLSTFPDDIRAKVYMALNDNRGLFLYGQVGRGKSMLAVAVMRELMFRTGAQWIDESWQRREANGWHGTPTRSEIDRYVNTACTAAMRCGAGIEFKNAAELMDEIKACFADPNGSGAKQKLVEWYSSVPVLVLDDLGMEKPTAFVRETFDVIVNRRWAEEMLTIFTSNLTFDQLEKHYEDEGRISSRIAGMCAVIELRGDDRRAVGK